MLWHLVTIDLGRKDWCDIVRRIVDSSRDYTVETKGDSISVKICADSLKTLRLRVNAFYETTYLVATMLETLSDS
ncbi:hypothetical protein BMR1_03g01659 [Babesia microti strain RI]|uniref:Transcription factor Pcc1 n=1 Tax=Babesia microti (strain RI) TaxID=1133968 RepID=A0A1R4ABI4_BABMR|nr:hypothetical protein BMR1_03g01659 [Babesia microti strain RI]SJK86372.1 hypothetical protein BMR1_03g01659 [Babesia microti strain RI]|eukprot:XP_021338534.1 hypothetical protein BMR1_03g01659 [Babesia microti strain RI]